MRHTTLWSSTHIPNIIDLSRKKQLFDLEVKGQGPTKVIMVLLLSEACPDHNFFVFPDRSMIFDMWVHDHKAVYRVP
jgi:hypothetical protein